MQFHFILFIYSYFAQLLHYDKEIQLHITEEVKGTAVPNVEISPHVFPCIYNASRLQRQFFLQRCIIEAVGADKYIEI